MTSVGLSFVTSHLEVPASWPLSLDVVRYKDLSSTESMSNSVGDSSANGSCVENSKVNESLLLMKFYPLSSGVVNFLLSDREDSKVDLPFEVTDQEREAVLYDRSTFILGRSGTGKTTVLTTKLYQKEQQHHMVDEGFYDVESNTVGHATLHNEAGQGSSSALIKGTVLCQRPAVLNSVLPSNNTFTLEKVSGLLKQKDVNLLLSFSLKLVVCFHWIHILYILNS